MENVTSTLTNLFAAADQRDWQQIERTFDDNVLIDYTSTTGKAPSWQTPRQITDSWAGILPGFDKTHHQVFDIEVDESQDSATAHCTGIVEHVIDTEVFTVEGTYDAILLKKGNDWVISQFRFCLKDWTGNSHLAQIAIERVKNAR